MVNCRGRGCNEDRHATIPLHLVAFQSPKANAKKKKTMQKHAKVYQENDVFHITDMQHHLGGARLKSWSKYSCPSVYHASFFHWYIMAQELQ
jgi:hypothetical protein